MGTLVGYLGVDQYGEHYRLTDTKHPRKQLLKKLGRRSARKMYTDLKSGGSRHAGYIVGNLWVSIYEVHAWQPTTRKEQSHGA